MRYLRTAVAFFIFVSGLWAADLNVKVLDPQSAVIRGARVTVYQSGSKTPAGLESTSSAGLAIFANLPGGKYQVQVLAPGFAPETISAEVPGEALSVKLSVSAETRNVVVSASRTPMPEDEGGAQTASLNEAQIQLLNPTATVDALRFLPGVVIGQNGRTGSLSSLFVRGGESRYNKVIVDGVTVNEDGGTFDFGVVPMQEMNRLELVRGADSTLVRFRRDDQRRTDVDRKRQHAHARASIRSRWRQLLDGERICFALRSTRTLRLQRVRQSVQHARTRRKRRDTPTRRKARIWAWRSRRRCCLRFHARHSNNFTGVQSFWNFNGQPYIPPDSDQLAHQNNFLASTELTIQASSHWQHRISGFEYNHKRSNLDTFMDPGRVFAAIRTDRLPVR